jgi:NADH dehydrogenase
MTPAHRVVIIGGGFGGLSAARALYSAPVQVTLIDRRNFHLFQPLLYQVATGGLSPANIAAPLRGILSRQRNCRVILGEVSDFDIPGKRVLLADGADVPFDSLILAAGAKHTYFNHPEWEALAPGLKTIEDATVIRRRVLTAFEQAERSTNLEEQQALTTFVVVGAGATGVELAGAVAELARYTLRNDFRNIQTNQSRVLLLEGQDRVLGTFNPALSAKALTALAKLGVTVRLNTIVTDIQPGLVTVKCGDKVETIRCHTVLWGAGVQGSPLGKKLAQATGAQVDRVGRVIVEPDCSVGNQPDIFVIGDLANYSHQGDKPLPGVAPVAIQQAQYVANQIWRKLLGRPRQPFQYRDKGSMATIGRASAVVDLGWLRFSGYLAWLAWLFVHLMFIIEFQNRLLVMIQWAFSYVTRGRAARLITETERDRPPAAIAEESEKK